jgi:hypothetical protein
MVIAPLYIRAPPLCTRLYVRLLKFLNLFVTYDWELPPSVLYHYLLAMTRKCPTYTMGGFKGTTIWRGTTVKCKCTKVFVFSPKTLLLLYGYIRVSEVEFIISLVRCRKWEPPPACPRPQKFKVLVLVHPCRS